MMVCALHDPFQVLVTKHVPPIMYIPTPSSQKKYACANPHGCKRIVE